MKQKHDFMIQGIIMYFGTFRRTEFQNSRYSRNETNEFLELSEAVFKMSQSLSDNTFDFQFQLISFYA